MESRLNKFNKNLLNEITGELLTEKQLIVFIKESSHGKVKLNQERAIQIRERAISKLKDLTHKSFEAEFNNCDKSMKIEEKCQQINKMVNDQKDRRNIAWRPSDEPHNYLPLGPIYTDHLRQLEMMKTQLENKLSFTRASLNDEKKKLKKLDEEFTTDLE